MVWIMPLTETAKNVDPLPWPVPAGTEPPDVSPESLTRSVRKTISALCGACLVGGSLSAQQPPSAADDKATIVFREDFADPTLPAWKKSWSPASGSATLKAEAGPNGLRAVAFHSAEVTRAQAWVEIPAAQVEGKSLLLDLWRKADGVKTGSRHYYNAKSMLIWQAAGAPASKNAGTAYTDFSGTTGWERHRYVVQLPEKLKWIRLSIGLQDCSGKASYAGLSVRIDPRFPTQQALEGYLAEEKRRLFAGLGPEDVRIRTRPEGTLQVFAGERYVPRKAWNAAVRGKVIAFGRQRRPRQSELQGASLRMSMARALADRSRELAQGLDGLDGAAKNDRVYEIASLDLRIEALLRRTYSAREIGLTIDDTRELPVSSLVFGNNINAEHLSAVYSHERGGFTTEFLNHLRPMAFTSMRYPGGCNADVFHWRESVGPLEQRGQFINYHFGQKRGPMIVGVDEFLRFCEAEDMEPVLTTAFLKDPPEKIMAEGHPKAGSLPYIKPFLESAPERIALAADWVEYCNGPVATPLGALRARNGHPQPYNVKYWEIGNESWGADRVGSTDAESYARAFPAYVDAMKARDPNIRIGINGYGGDPQWNDALLRISADRADFFQIHIYRAPRFGDYDSVEQNPEKLAPTMKQADTIPPGLDQLEKQMRKHLGRTLPVMVTEFGMGNARHREVMVSLASATLVADMIRVFLESPLVLGANKWALYGGYWFSQINGPSRRNPRARYYIRPEQIMHTIYARLRSAKRHPVRMDDAAAASAVAFARPDGLGVVLISREPRKWQRVRLDLGHVSRGASKVFLLTGGHPLLGNDNDHGLIREYGLEFDYEPDEGILLPPNSVMGLLLPRGVPAG